MTDIWTSLKLGKLELKNRLVMAPMTRSRAAPSGVPGPLAATYYAHRAGVGLLISEGTQPSDQGQGYILTPGIYTDAHVEGWKRITAAVHQAGSRLFIQLMHVGRMSHPDNVPDGAEAVAPSAIAPGVQMFTAEGMKPIPVPKALSIEEIGASVDDHRRAAIRAIEAGADGIEIHGANGYLIQQFIAPNANQRDDAYGGTIENRARYAVEVAAAVADAIGPERTGIRLSPGGGLGGLDEGPEGPTLYRHLVPELNRLGLAYLHIVHAGDETLLAHLRAAWDQVLIVNRPGRVREDIGSDIAAGLADLESFGQFALANPDFADRLRAGAAFNPAHRASFFGGGAEGYTDYPILNGKAGTT